MEETMEETNHTDVPVVQQTAPSSSHYRCVSLLLAPTPSRSLLHYRGLVFSWILVTRKLAKDLSHNRPRCSGHVYHRCVFLRLDIECEQFRK